MLFILVFSWAKGPTGEPLHYCQASIGHAILSSLQPCLENHRDVLAKSEKEHKASWHSFIENENSHTSLVDTFSVLSKSTITSTLWHYSPRKPPEKYCPSLTKDGSLDQIQGVDSRGCVVGRLDEKMRYNLTPAEELKLGIPMTTCAGEDV